MEKDLTINSILAKLEEKARCTFSDLMSDGLTRENVELALTLLAERGVVRTDVAAEEVWLMDCVDEETTDNNGEQQSIYSYPFDASMDIKDGKFSVFEYLRKLSNGLIEMNPEFQRKEIWKDEQKSRFIESVILNIPIPPFYFKSKQRGEMVVVDGLQRTSALREFMGNKLTLCGLKAMSQLNGMNYDGLKGSNYAHLITRIEDRQLNYYLLDFRTPMNVVYDIFNRINTGGTNLEPQEIRNCVFIGNSTRLLKRLAENKAFSKAVDEGISDDRMKLREAALRCISFTINDYETVYKGSMNDFLEKTMMQLNKMQQSEIDQIERDFISVMNRTVETFGRKNFRRPTSNTRGRINIAVMETVFYAFYKLMKRGEKPDCEVMRRAFEKLLRDADYIDSVRNSTSSISKVRTRFELTERIFGL